MPMIPESVRQALISPVDGQLQGALLQAEGDTLLPLSSLTAEDKQTALEAFREDITAAFTQAWGRPSKVEFDFELGEN